MPIESEIEVEVKVLARDIGRVRTGDAVRVKLDAFPFQKHDTLPGTVRVISENSFHPEGLAALSEEKNESDRGIEFYRARVRLLSSKLRNVPEGFRLMPGMRARAEIKIGQRPVISYFLYPVIRALDESLREP